MDDQSAPLDNRKRARHQRARDREVRLRRRVMASLALVVVASGAGVTAELASGEAPPPALPPPVVPSVNLNTGDGILSVAFAGDTLLGDAAQARISVGGYQDPLYLVTPLLEADFTVANLEGPLTERSEPWDADEPYSYNASPIAADFLAGVGIDALGLANNHTLDRGPLGLADTFAHATRVGVQTLGAGLNRTDAVRPLLVRSEVGTVGIVALADGISGTAGRIDRAGVAPLNDETIVEAIATARAAGADWVIAFVHWGENYSGVEGQQRELAQRFADAGYNLVVGHHGHVLQPIEMFGSMPVVYGIGNFVFGTPGQFTKTLPGYGAVVSADFGAGLGLGRLRLRCLVTDNEIVDYQPRPCSEPETYTALKPLHPNLTITGDTGWLNLPVGQ